MKPVEIKDCKYPNGKYRRVIIDGCANDKTTVIMSQLMNLNTVAVPGCTDTVRIREPEALLAVYNALGTRVQEMRAAGLLPEVKASEKQA